MKKVILLIAMPMMIIAQLVSCMKDAKEYKEEEYLREVYKPENVGLAPKDEDGYHPYYNFPGTGNFEDICELWYKNPDIKPEDHVGVWYENGFTNGYRLEIYGDATWQFFADKTYYGYCEFVPNGKLNLVDGKYGLNAGEVAAYPIDDEGGKGLTVQAFYPEVFKGRNYDINISFVCEEKSTYCDDLDKFYSDMFPYSYLAGNWYPVGDYSAQNYFDIDVDGRWGEQIDGEGMLEIGLLEDQGDGKFYSKGGNWEEDYYFEFTDDGYMYCNEVQYERRDVSDETKELIIDKWHFYDIQKDCKSEAGYEFFEDGTFKTLTDNPNESGTYIFVGVNVILYDEDGVWLHAWYFPIDFARKKWLYMPELNEDLYGDKPKVMPDYEKMFGDPEDMEEVEDPEEEPEDEIMEYDPEEFPDDADYDDDDDLIWEGEDDG